MNKKEHKNYFRSWSKLNAGTKISVLMAITAIGGLLLVLGGNETIGMMVIYSAIVINVAVALLYLLGRRRK